MDKSWITKPRNSVEYEQGVRGFITFAFERRSVNDKIICPCSRCGFRKWQTRDVVYDHLICKQFPEGYTLWFYHGESDIGETSNVSSSNVLNVVEDTMVDEDPIQNMINDAFGVDRHHANEVPIPSNEESGRVDRVTPNVTQHLQPTLPEVQNPQPTQLEAQNPPHLEPDEAEDPPCIYGKKCNKYWTLDVIDEEGVVKETRLKVQDVFVLRAGKKVMTEWNVMSQPIGESGGLLGGFLGAIASNFDNFPIIYINWRKVPGTYKEHVWNNTIKKKFVVNDGENKKYILQNLGKKWKDNKCRLFYDHYNFDLGWEANLDLHPERISREHWATYLNHRLSEETMAICEKNVANRQKQTIPHTLGSKTIARKKHELEIQSGRPYSRGEIYPITHMKKDGSFVNPEAKQKSEELEKETEEAPSENEAYTKVFGKEHSGYVRGMGFGVCPSQVFGPTCHSGGSTSSSHSDVPSKVEYEKLKLEVATNTVMLKELLAYIMQTNEGQLPPGFPNLGVNQATDLGSPADARHSSGASHKSQSHGPSSST